MVSGAWSKQAQPILNDGVKSLQTANWLEIIITRMTRTLNTTWRVPDISVQRHSSSTCGQMISGCPSFCLSHCCDYSISRMCCGNFFQFGSKVHFDWRSHRLEFKVTVTSQYMIFGDMIFYIYDVKVQLHWDIMMYIKKEEAQVIIQCQTETWLVIPVLFTWRWF